MTDMGKKKVLVEVTSDTVCPWCFVGKKRLEKAIIKFQDKLDFEVKWRPYQLNPTAPKEGIDKLGYYNSKFGAARTAQIIPHMTQVYAELGLSYSIGGLTGNTLDSHRLIEWAGSRYGAEKQNALVEELFLNYFCQEKYINDRDVLVAAAEEVGLPGAEAAAYLADPNNGLKEVQDMMAGNYAINGVPHFTINKKYKVGGAQSPEVFEDLFEQLAAH